MRCDQQGRRRERHFSDAAAAATTRGPIAPSDRTRHARRLAWRLLLVPTVMVAFRRGHGGAVLGVGRSAARRRCDRRGYRARGTEGVAGAGPPGPARPRRLRRRGAAARAERRRRAADRRGDRRRRDGHREPTKRPRRRRADAASLRPVLAASSASTWRISPRRRTTPTTRAVGPAPRRRAGGVGAVDRARASPSAWSIPASTRPTPTCRASSCPATTSSTTTPIPTTTTATARA